MIARRTVVLFSAAVLAIAIAGCGEREQVVVYKQGKYQGKPDTKPWNNPEFGDSKAKWEDTIRARNQNQNEYRRIPG